MNDEEALFEDSLLNTDDEFLEQHELAYKRQLEEKYGIDYD